MSKDCYVYFIADNNSHIKIGISCDVNKRLHGLQIANADKLKLVFVIKCLNKNQAEELEAYLHLIFNLCRMSGEWFNREPVINFIAELNGLFELEREKDFLYVDLVPEVLSAIEEIGTDLLIAQLDKDQKEALAKDMKCSDALERIFA